MPNCSRRITNSRLLEKLETLGWPQPFAEALDPYDDPRVAEFQTAFVDLLTLEHLYVCHGSPQSSATDPPVPVQPSEQPHSFRRQTFAVCLGVRKPTKAPPGTTAARASSTPAL